jgi:hypothetical protein
MEPPSGYGDFVRQVLRQSGALHRWTRQALEAEHPDRVFLSIQEDGHMLALNYNPAPAKLKLPGGHGVVIEPYGIQRLRLR